MCASFPAPDGRGIGGTRDGALLVRLNAPPVDGAANAELIQLIAKALGVPKRDVEIVSGQRSRDKRIRVAGRTTADVEQIFSSRPSS